MKSIFLLICFISGVLSLDNGLGLTPPLGFNTWNRFRCNISDTLIRETADAIVKLGLKDLGYVYINIDDCWMDKKRVNGKLVPDPKRFPNGIKTLADYCHSKGLKLGIYSSAGNMTCQKYPASEGHEDVDAQTWASWDIDYLKYDNCYRSNASAQVRYSKMRDALNKTGRPIYYSICSWGRDKVWEWAKTVGNSWRTTRDIRDNFNSMRNIYIQNVNLSKWAGPSGWNDPDMLEVGNGKMNNREYRTHFSLWSMAKSPLLIGCDLRNTSKETLNILMNKDIIDLNQDKLGKQSVCKVWCDKADFGSNAKHPQYGVMELSNRNYAISITNWNDRKSFNNIKVNFRQLELKEYRYRVKDLWTKKEMGVITEQFTIPILTSHETIVYHLTMVA